MHTPYNHLVENNKDTVKKAQKNKIGIKKHKNESTFLQISGLIVPENATVY